MMRSRTRAGRLLALVVALAIAGSVYVVSRALTREPSGNARARMRVSSLLGAVRDSGYARAVAPRAFHFPEDHGVHPEYRTEWWYFTGNLESAEGHRFGYQLTFFRQALTPGRAQAGSEWSARDAYMAHFALTDAAAGRFHAYEQLERGAAGLAGATPWPVRVWVGDWSVAATSMGAFRLRAQRGDTAIDLRLEPAVPPVLQGQDGLSRKGPEPGNASYYYSVPRMRTRGTLRVGGATVPVQGVSWMDREWSTSALSSGQRGWDWFALRLDDGRDFMFYRLRTRAGKVDSLSAGTLSRNGRVLRRYRARDVSIHPTRTWESPDGTRYPIAWTLAAPGLGKLRISALLPHQELDLSVRYWEGAVVVAGAHAAGRGYVELTGYDNSGP